MVASSPQAKTPHRGRQLSLVPLEVRETCPKDPRESFTLQEVKLKEKLREGEGVDCAEEEADLWEG